MEACREYGIRVGLYYSPDDWYRERHRRSFGYEGAPLGLRHEPIELPTPSDEEKRQWAEEEAPYVKGQVEELLTRYGDIDLIWFDGPAPSIPVERIRELQPDIVVNDRGHGKGSGDFSTFECRYESLEPERPDRPFEFCTTTIDQYDHLVTAYLGAPSWGHIDGARYRPLALLLEEFVKVRAWGGNYLLNFGPTRDGELPADAYRALSGLGAWMRHSGVSLTGAGGGPWPHDSNVPVTVKEEVAEADGPGRAATTWYLHLLPGFAGVAEVSGVSEPRDVRLLRTGEPLRFECTGPILRLRVPSHLRSDLVDVVEVVW